MKAFFKVLFILVILSLASSCNDLSYDPIFPEKGGSTSAEAPKMGKVYAEQTSATTATVTWSATDDLTPQNELSYDIHLSQQPNFTPDTTTLKTTILGVTNVDIDNLGIGKTYYILVIASDKNGFQSLEREHRTITMVANYESIDVMPTILPEPPVLPPISTDDQLTLEGIDSDRDGIRDDVQRFITLTYSKPEDKPLRSALREYAAYQQQRLINSNNSMKVSLAVEYSKTAVGCITYFQPTSAVDILLDIDAQILNTEQRSDAYITSEGWLGGQVFVSVPYESLPQVCSKFTTTLQTQYAKIKSTNVATCKKQNVIVVYGNGMANSESISMNSLDRLQMELEKVRSSNETLKAQNWSYRLSYNEQENVLKQNAELLRQNHNSSGIGKRLQEYNKDDPESASNKKTTEIIDKIAESEYKTDQDLATHIGHYKQWIAEGSKVVVVAHSQGNFYANIAYSNLTEEEKASFGIVSVANPANFVAGGGPYTTDSGDKMINWFVKFGDIITPNKNPLPSNIANQSYTGKHDPKGHGFVETYMNGEQTKLKIINDIMSVVAKLKTPKGAENAGGVVEAVQGKNAPENRTISFGVNEGSFQFDYDTYSVKDKITIQYEGQTIFDTGCVGKSDSVKLPFKGNTSEITVAVKPNCKGTSDTAWNFTIHCPAKNEAISTKNKHW